MITENLSTLKIHKLTQNQYDRELEAGRIDTSALYLTPDVNALPTAGGVMTGTLTTHGIVLTENVDYGTELPAEAPEGKIFFLKV